MSPMAIDPVFSELVGLLYEGPLEEAPWESFLGRCREVMGAAVVSLILRAPSRAELGLMRTSGGMLENIQSYNQRLYALDPFINLPEGQVFSLHEYLGTEVLLNGDFYRLCMEPSGLYDVLGADIRVPGELEARLRIGRSQGSRPFGEAEHSLCEALLPHLRRAARLYSRFNQIESERALYAGAVDQLKVATVVLDERGRVVSTNRRAQDLLGHRSGLWVREDELQLEGRGQTEELQRRIAKVLARVPSGAPQVVEAMRVPRKGDAPDLGLVIRPVPVSQRAEGEAIPAVAVFISDPSEQSDAPLQIITELFGFTPTEAQLSLLLANGLSLDEAAESLGVSRNTVRTHLRSVFSKTGVTRQPLLVRLILKSVASLG